MGLLRKETSLARHRRAPGSTERSVPGLSYYSRRSEETLNTGRNQKREIAKRATRTFVNFWLRRFGLAVLLIAALICLVDVLSLSTSPQIVIVTGSNWSLHDQSAYQAATSRLLSSSIWNHNKLTINTTRVSKQLQGKFPELTSVSMTLPLFAHHPVVYIQTSTPALILVGGTGSYVLGTDGKALALASSDPALVSLHLPVVVDQSGLKLALNHQVLTANNVNFIQTVIAQLSARQFTVSSLILPPAASELDVHVRGQPYFVKFNLQSGDARQQAGTFLATQTHLKSQNIVPSAYIDVRVDGRAYYK